MRLSNAERALLVSYRLGFLTIGQFYHALYPWRAPGVIVGSGLYDEWERWWKLTGGRVYGDKGIVRVVRISLDGGGYTKWGRYYGVGAPLYRAVGEEHEYEFRAASREVAVAMAAAAFPKAKVQRTRWDVKD